MTLSFITPDTQQPLNVFIAVADILNTNKHQDISNHRRELNMRIVSHGWNHTYMCRIAVTERTMFERGNDILSLLFFYFGGFVFAWQNSIMLLI